ncbi:MAG: UvrD-helicase domain-containing protein [Pleomorphochaeta sp.]
MISIYETNLNDEQINAILEPNNILLVACPGSGKTKTLTYKIAYELDHLKNNNKHIIAITYTNRAADEIKERIELLGVDTKNLWIGTIHSFCIEWILKPYFIYIGELKYGFQIIGVEEKEELINKLCCEYNESYNTKITYYDCNNYQIEFPFKIEFFNYIDSDKKDKIKKILKKYNKILLDSNKIDFELILYYSLKIISENNNIAKGLSNIFQYILIDEYQDTKKNQYDIIGTILKNSTGNLKLFMVGDPNQSIYNSMGGYSISLEDLEQISRLKIKKIYLTKNYRSSEKIIKYFNHYKTEKSLISSCGENKNYPSIINLEKNINKDNLIEYLSNLIKYNIEELNISENQICILAPQWFLLTKIAKKLMISLPEQNFNGPCLSPLGRDIDNFWYKLSRIVLTESSPELYIIRLRWISEIILELEEQGVILQSFDNKSLLKLCNSIKSEEKERIAYLHDFFNQFLKAIKVNIDSNKFLKESYSKYFIRAQNRIDKLINEGFEYVTSIEAYRKIFKQKNGITISTFHGVKGSEFDTVIAFALLDGYIPNWYDPKGDINSKKLMYVISSRARKNLFLIAEKGRYTRSGKNEYLITRQLKNYNYKYDYT